MDDNNNLQPEQSAEAVVVDSQSQVVPTDPSDKLTEEHPRFKQVLSERNELRATVSELKEQMDKIQSQVSQRQNETGDETLTSEEEIALARVEKLLAKRGFVKTDQLDRSERETKRALLFEKLSEKYQGQNGLPAFDVTEVISHARKNGFNDDQLERAYKDLHFDAIVEAESKKRVQRNAVDSEKPTGNARQLTPQVTVDDVPKLSDNDYEKNRDGILARMKAMARNASRLE